MSCFVFFYFYILLVFYLFLILILFLLVWFLVDGIYPELARFVKTVSEPMSPATRSYTKWQEGSRKSIERAFGVFGRKFQI